MKIIKRVAITAGALLGLAAVGTSMGAVLLTLSVMR